MTSGWTVYRLGLRRPARRPDRHDVPRRLPERVGEGEGAFAGLGFDVTAFQGGAPGPYVVAGVGAGMGSPHSRSFSSLWTSWSAGARLRAPARVVPPRRRRVPLARDVARQPGRAGAGGGALVQLREAAGKQVSASRARRIPRRRSARRLADAPLPATPRVATPAARLRRRGHRDRDRGHGPALRIRRHRRGRRRLRLLGPDPVRLRPPRRHAAAPERRPGAGGHRRRARATRRSARATCSRSPTAADR